MTSSDGSARDPLDPDFAGLFRPEPTTDEPPISVEPDSVPEPAPQPEPTAVESALPVEEEPPAPPVADPVADTGRLFRSQGVIGRDDAVLALSGDRRLRTLERRSEEEPAPAVVVPGAVLLDDAGAPVVHQVIPAPEHVAAPEASVTETPRSRRHRSRSITAGAVYVVVIGATFLVALLNAWLADGDLGWPTGLALVASSVYAALTVRREDDTAAIIIPPVAFLIAALTAGQVFVGSLEGSLLNRAVVVFFTLADNWVWIIGATVAALAIVLVRRRRG